MARNPTSPPPSSGADSGDYDLEGVRYDPNEVSRLKLELEQADQLAKDQGKERRQRRLKKIHEAAKKTGQIARGLGREDLAQLTDIVEGGTGVAGGAAADRGERIKTGVTGLAGIAGRQAGNIAQSGKFAGKDIKIKGKELPKVSAGGGALISGGVAAALRGGGVKGIVKGAGSAWILWVLFGGLFSVVGFIPALIGLDFWFIMSKVLPNTFSDMAIWQKGILFVANLLAVMIIMLALVLPIAVIVSPCYLEGFSGAVASTVSKVVSATGAIDYDICSLTSGSNMLASLP